MGAIVKRGGIAAGIFDAKRAIQNVPLISAARVQRRQLPLRQHSTKLECSIPPRTRQTPAEWLMAGLTIANKNIMICFEWSPSLANACIPHLTPHTQTRHDLQTTNIKDIEPLT